MPKPEVLTAAILKVASGTPELAASLTPDAFLTEVSIAAPTLSCSNFIWKLHRCVMRSKVPLTDMLHTPWQLLFAFFSKSV